MTSITNRAMPSAIARRVKFTGHSTSAPVSLFGPSPLRLDDGHCLPWGHRLPEDWAAVLRNDIATVGVVYVVKSYATPIAWQRLDGVVVIPDVRYSPTASRAQSLCRQGFAGSDIVTTIDEAHHGYSVAS